VLGLATGFIALSALSACSNKSGSPTGPGGGGGTTLNSGALATGGSYSFTFADSGTFGYRCGLHPLQMNGYTVRATSSSVVDSVLVSIVSIAGGMNPAAATIKIGGKVRWVNNDGMAHSIESE
jgi:plastocyanin